MTSDPSISRRVTLAGVLLLTCLGFNCFLTSAQAVRCPEYLRSVEQFRAELIRNPGLSQPDSHTLRQAHGTVQELAENDEAIARSYRRTQELSAPYRREMRDWDGPVGLSGMSDSAYAAEILRYIAARRARITERYRDVLLELVRIAREREGLSERHAQLLEQLNRLRLRLRANCDDDDPGGGSSCAGTGRASVPDAVSQRITGARSAADRALDGMTSVPEGATEGERNQAIRDWWEAHGGGEVRYNGFSPVPNPFLGASVGLLGAGTLIDALAASVGRWLGANAAAGELGSGLAFEEGGGMATAGLIPGLPGLAPIPPPRESRPPASRIKPSDPAYSAYKCQYSATVPVNSPSVSPSNASVSLAGANMTYITKCYSGSEVITPDDLMAIFTADHVIGERTGGAATNLKVDFSSPVVALGFEPLASGPIASAAKSTRTHGRTLAHTADSARPPSPRPTPTGSSGSYRASPLAVYMNATFNDQTSVDLSGAVTELINRNPHKVDIRIDRNRTIRIPTFPSAQLQAHSC